MENTNAQSLQKKQLINKLLAKKAIKKPLLSISAREDLSQKIPVSSAQKKLWVLHSLRPEETAYNLVSCFKVVGNLNIKVLQKALDALENQHEMLRTVFRMSPNSEDNQIYQYIYESGKAPFEVLDLRNEEKLDGLDDQKIFEEANVSFDFEKGPLWKVTLIRTEDNASVLMVNVHHIAFDGWSLGVFIRQLFEFYSSIKYCGMANAEKLPIQYADYSLWQAKKLEEDFRNQTTFWKKYLKGMPIITELPYDKGRNVNSNTIGALQTLIMDRHQFLSLCEIGKKHDATPFYVFMSILKILIYRYCEQEDIIVGSPVSGRENKDTHHLIGILSNTVPIRTQVNSSDTFLTVLDKCKKSALQVFQNSELPFDAIVEAVKPERIVGANPVFQIFYAYQNRIDPVEVDGASIVYEIRDFGRTKFDLSVDVVEGPQGLSIIFEYDTSLFNHSKITRMMGHFDQLSKDIMENKGLEVKHLNYLPYEELSIISDQGIKRSLPEEYLGSFKDKFKHHVNNHPNDISVVYKNERLAYQDLEVLSSVVAYEILQEDVQPGSVIGLRIPKSNDLIISMLACLKLGCPFVILDQSYPQDRRIFMAKDANVKLIITHSELLQKDPMPDEFNGISYDEISRESGTNNISEKIQTLNGIEILPDQAAYLAYTSGTTGLPKGVSISHRNWLNALYGWESVYCLGSARSHLQMASTSFDVFLGDFIRALGSGGKLVLCPKDTLAVPENLLNLIEDESVDIAEFVPVVFRRLAAYLDAEAKKLDSMKILIVASDAWRVNECADFKKVIGEKTRLFNSYGMVEATIDSTYYELKEFSANEQSMNKMVPIGKPFHNVDIYILDKFMNIRPYGVAGEIYVGGYGVSSGYINNRELTEKSFFKNPFLKGSNEYIYKTGDLGFLDEQGNLILAGRQDNQIKLRGQRIELSEVESQIVNYISVKECVVILDQRNGDDEFLVAYIIENDVSKEGEATDVFSLKQYLMGVLPIYMIPDYFIILDELPLSNNGKVDRKKLPMVDAHFIDQSFVSPRNITEEILSGIWTQALGKKRVGIYDDFFMLGGHSLTALEVLTHMQKNCGVELSRQDIFTYRTIEGLAKKIVELQGVKTVSSVKDDLSYTIEPNQEDRFKPFPLTAVQQAYWIGRNDSFELGNISAHSYDEFEVTDLDIDRFERAWNKVIKKHDMLRTIVLSSGSQQILESVPDYKIKVVDTTDEKSEMSLLKEARERLSHQIIDVENWPTFDAQITKLKNKRAILHLSTDAIMFDVTGFLLMLNDLVDFYLNESIAAIPPKLSFRDYVLGEQKLIHGSKHKKALEYWKAKAPFLPQAPELPLSNHASQIIRPRFTRLHNVLDSSAWARLKERAARIGITPSGFMLAAYAEVLAENSRNDQFSLNLTFLNRRPLHKDINTVVGEFTSITLLAIDSRCATNFVERAKRIQENLWSDLEHNDVSGIEVLRELSRISGDATNAKLPVVFTSALGISVPEKREDFDFKPLHTSGVTQTSQVWLDCGVWEENGKLLCNWDVIKEMYPVGFIGQMFNSFWELLSRFAEDGELWNKDRLFEYDRESERYPLKIERDFSNFKGTTLVSKFVDHLSKYKDNIAITSGDLLLTYEQLAESACWVSKQIHNFVQKRDIVAVIMDKGWEQVSSTLGIMLSGAAYLPIDSKLPDSRIKLLLERAHVTQVITQPWLAERLGALPDIRLLSMDQNCKEPLSSIDRNRFPKGSDLAYVIFTSGSTGQPKGVMIDHRGFMNTILDINNRLNISSFDKVLAVSAFNFDLSVYDMYGMLEAGGTIVFPDFESRLSPVHWHDLIQKNQITIWNTVPALMGLLANFVISRQFSLPSLKHVLLSGDWIPLHLPNNINQIAENAEILSLGGATEASIWSILYPVKLPLNPSWQSIPYGKAMVNQQMYVLDAFLGPCPTWVVGDIYIGGIGLAIGYLGDEDKTNAAFITHPVSHERLYKTGDIGRWMDDENIEFLGRSDFQVKVQGYRIELGEIESEIVKIDAVQDAIVKAIGDKHEEKFLVAYIILNDQSSIGQDEIRIRLLSQLPEYMVPRRYEFMKEFPLTPNGKIDRSQLSNNYQSKPNQKKEFIPPQSVLQKSLCSLLEEVLGVNKVGLSDNFLKLGGDSMGAIMLLTRIKSDLEININLNQVLGLASIKELSDVIEKNNEEKLNNE